VGWLRLDDAFGDHPKIAGLSDRAFRAHVLGLLYCARQVSDGFVPTALAPKGRTLAELTTAGLWTAVRRGFTIHDWLDWNPSRAEVDSKRHAKSMAGAKGAASRWHDEKNAPIPSHPLPQPKDLKPSPPRKRDEIADTLARIEGGDPLEVPPSHMRTLCVKANELRKVAPDVTSAEVERRAANWSGHMHDATISGPAVVKHWARLAQPAKPTAATNHPLDRMARDLIEGVNANGDRGSTSPGAAPVGELPGVAGE
jgi:hypothetical protein